MCIIVYKPANVAFPKKKTLKTCFEYNSDGAGFMYAVNNEVHIAKGFMGFTAFNKALRQVRMKYGDDIPYVLHFRISTQAGARPDCCHPYPLSRNMDDLRQLHYTTDIGIAHNGIIELTSEELYGYGYKSHKVDYNDTMKFITDYLALLIHGRNFYQSEDTLTLIERLVESKLAILDGSGRCTLIGKFIEDNGVYYSNTSYLPVEHKTYSDSAWWKAPTKAKASSTEWSPLSVGNSAKEASMEYDYVDMYNCGYENFGTFEYCELCTDKCDCPEYKWAEDTCVIQ